MKTASIFLKDEVYMISSNGSTTKGMLISVAPVVFEKQTIKVSDLGKRAIEILNTLTTILPHPNSKEELNSIVQGWYKAMKIKSWHSFAKNSKGVELVLQDTQIKVIPTRNNQPKGNFSHLTDKARVCLAHDPEALGQAIIDAFADCE